MGRRPARQAPPHQGRDPVRDAPWAWKPVQYIPHILGYVVKLSEPNNKSNRSLVDPPQLLHPKFRTPKDQQKISRRLNTKAWTGETAALKVKKQAMNQILRKCQSRDSDYSQIRIDY